MLNFMEPCFLDTCLKWPLTSSWREPVIVILRVKAPRPFQGFPKISDPKVRSKDAPPNSVDEQYWNLHDFVLEDIFLYCELESTEYQNFFLMGQSIKEAHCKKKFWNLQGNSN